MLERLNLSRQKIISIVVIAMTLIFLVLAIVLGLRLSQLSQAPIDSFASNTCFAGRCGNGTSFNGDCSYSGDCEQRAQSFCSDKGGVAFRATVAEQVSWCCANGQACANPGTSGPPPQTNNTCQSGGSHSCNGENPGFINVYGQNQTCVCTRTTGTSCACVPTNGTACGNSQPQNVTANNWVMGGSCSIGASVGTIVSAGVNANGTICNCKLAPVQSPPPVDQEIIDICSINTETQCNNTTTMSWCSNVNGTPVNRCFPRNNAGEVNCTNQIGNTAAEVINRINSVCGGSQNVVVNENKCDTNPNGCNAGYYCNADKICTAKLANEQHGCEGINNRCLSNNCIRVNMTWTCKPAGFVVQDNVVTIGNECTTDASAGAGFYCENGTRRALLPEGRQCTRNSQCNTGLCSSYVCRVATTGGTGSCENGTIPNGQWKCEETSGQRNGFGQMCSNGQLQTRTKADACAPAVTGQTCSNLDTFSGGESSRGRFVGCNTSLNCFCPHTTGSPGSLFSSNNQNISPQCVSDIGNDSCGAGTLEQPPSSPPPQEPPPPTDEPPQNPPPPDTPYCGDAVCATGELCERVSAGSTTYRACTATGAAPTGSVVNNCFGVNFNQPVTTTTCKYCGDGVFTPGNEQCDPTAPAGNGNDPVNCTVNCSLVGQVCIDLTENGSDPITAGVGNVMEYVFVYQNSSTVNPYPNIRMAVNTFASPLGRDANNTSQALVAPSQAPTFNALNNQWTYRFLWEAADPSGVDVADGTYNVRVYLDGTAATETTSPSACIENITVNSVTPQNPLFTIIKQSNHVCDQTTGDAIINYTVVVRNVGPVSGVIDFVEDQIDPNVRTLGISPTNIIPAYGVYNQTTGILNWTGSTAERTYATDQSRNFTYQIRIPSANLLTFFNLGVYNQATVQYDTNTTNDNTASFDVRTMLNCTVNSIPITNIPEGMRTALFGCLIMMLGLLVFVTERGRRVSESLYFATFTPAINFIKDWTIPGFREQRILDERFEEKVRDGK